MSSTTTTDLTPEQKFRNVKQRLNRQNPTNDLDLLGEWVIAGSKPRASAPDKELAQLSFDGLVSFGSSSHSPPIQTAVTRNLVIAMRHTPAAPKSGVIHALQVAGTELSNERVTSLAAAGLRYAATAPESYPGERFEAFKALGAMIKTGGNAKAHAYAALTEIRDLSLDPMLVRSAEQTLTPVQEIG